MHVMKVPRSGYHTDALLPYVDFCTKEESVTASPMPSSPTPETFSSGDENVRDGTWVAPFSPEGQIYLLAQGFFTPFDFAKPSYLLQQKCRK